MAYSAKPDVKFTEFHVFPIPISFLYFVLHICFRPIYDNNNLDRIAHSRIGSIDLKLLYVPFHPTSLFFLSIPPRNRLKAKSIRFFSLPRPDDWYANFSLSLSLSSLSLTLNFSMKKGKQNLKKKYPKSIQTSSGGRKPHKQDAIDECNHFWFICRLRWHTGANSTS